MKTPEDEKIDQRITRAINEYGLWDKIRECDYSYGHLFNVLRSIYLEGAFDQIEASQSKPQEIPEENRQKLFNHMSTEYGLTLLESEMNSIYSICIGHEEYVKYLNWLHSKPQEIEWLSEDEIRDATAAGDCNWEDLNGFIEGAKWLQSELQNRIKPVDTKTVDAVDPTFWRRLEMFVSNIQVNDMAGEEEKQYIIHVIESKK